jgi:ferritin-like metal-binding protein YciE
MEAPVAETLDDLFLDTRKDIYFAERQILRALPKMERAAQASDLKAAFKKHQEETQGHIERPQELFEILDKPFGTRPAKRSRASLPRAKKSSKTSPVLPRSMRD